MAPANPPGSKTGARHHGKVGKRVYVRSEVADAQPRAHATRTSRATRRPNGMKQALTSKQQLATTIKSVRDLLRKDAGLSGDTDRLPQLTWLLFLKAFGDFEYARAEEHGDAYTPVIVAPYRWRDWADVLDKTQRLTGDELLEFVNGRLIPHLSEIAGAGEHDIRIMVGTIFQGTYNRIRSGYILREVVDKLSTINFNASEGIHTVSVFYDTMLREMRDAAGDAGEFYTLRPVVRFIIDRLAPQLGERVLDPACGTCGFLVETYERLRSEVRTPEQLADDILRKEQEILEIMAGIKQALGAHAIAEGSSKGDQKSCRGIRKR